MQPQKCSTVSGRAAAVDEGLTGWESPKVGRESISLSKTKSTEVDGKEEEENFPCPGNQDRLGGLIDHVCCFCFRADK